MMEVLTETRQEFLQEMINISFGHAAASLAELLSVCVELGVPKVNEVDGSQISCSLVERVGEEQETTVVQQAFNGDFSGEVLLIIPSELGKQAVNIMTEGSGFDPDMPMEEMETEMLLEIGNIVIGACMGQFSDLLTKSVTYEAPTIILENAPVSELQCGGQGEERRALIVLTKFEIGEETLSGFLFILLNERWFDSLYLAVDQFIEQLSA